MSNADDRNARARTRVVTVEKAQAFAKAITDDLSHSVESASHAVGLHPKTVRVYIAKYENDECRSEDELEVCAILAAAKAEHIRQLRIRGEMAAEDAKGPGVAWYKWRLETQAPKEHPRTSAVEVSGPGGGAVQIETTQLSDAEIAARLAKIAGKDATEESDD